MNKEVKKNRFGIEPGQVIDVEYVGVTLPCTVFEDRGGLFFYHGQLCFSVLELNYNPYFKYTI